MAAVKKKKPKKAKLKHTIPALATMLATVLLYYRPLRIILTLSSFRLFAYYYFGLGLYDHQHKWLKNAQRFKQSLTLGPRGHGKSEAISKLYVIWRICKNRNIRILMVSKAKGLSVKLLEAVKYEFENNAELVADFGRFHSKYNKWQDQLIYVIRDRNLKDPTIEAIGILGTVTGSRYDLIIFDDIIDSYSVREDTQRRKTLDYVRDTIIPLLEPSGQILAVATRKHYGDVYAWMIKQALWKVFSYKAIIREPESYEIRELDKPVMRTFEDGEEYEINHEVVITSTDRGQVLCEEKWPMEDLLLLRFMIGTVAFNREYQNVIVDDVNALFKIKDLEGCRDENLSYVIGDLSEAKRAQGLALIQGDDPSLVTSKKHAEKTDSDYHVIVTWQIKDKGMIDWIGFFEERGVSPKKAQTNIENEYNRFNPDLHFLETNAFGSIHAQNLIDETNMKIIKHHTGGNKQDLYQGVPGLSVLFENRKIRLPYRTEEDKIKTDRIINQFHALGSAEHDDIVMAAWICNCGVTRWQLGQATIRKLRKNKG